ncbi:MAG TPA: hypothetical protein VNW15_06690 [Rhizomicrobium sp.]|jgi:hypothetical protein|nr:hypothetical protein [Rhizomicrobium sp.]
MSIRGRSFLFAALALAASAGIARADYFLNGYYTPTTGKVGQHLESDAAFGVTDTPDQCAVDWKDIVITGTLPPGLDISNSFSSVIAGTPTQAGDWAVTVTFHDLGCSAIPTGRVDRAIRVKYHITP